MADHDLTDHDLSNRSYGDAEFTEFAGKIASIIGVPAARLSPDTVVADLGLESMTTVELVVDLQEDYDVLLSREDFDDVTTLGDLAGLIFQRLPQRDRN
ncbi:acyl carrier protein [Streptomyces paludis]|uniref:acyl carrier protein n=1 Tax=Streptomyces paludis TaxID=2282738 RepID=UPI0013B444EC|nr:acyl carrier protein [Streptomyces paludis]